MKTLLTALLILLLTAPAWATDYYVDADAAGGGDGTTTDLTGSHCAFKTIAEVEAGVSAGSHTVYFQRGDTWPDELTVVAGVTYDAYGTGDAPIIDANDDVNRCFYGNDVDNVTIKNFHLKNAEYHYIMNVDGDNWTIDSVQFTCDIVSSSNANGIYCNSTGAAHSDITVNNSLHKTSESDCSETVYINSAMYSV